jgi:hypothetical protein
MLIFVGITLNGLKARQIVDDYEVRIEDRGDEGNGIALMVKLGKRGNPAAALRRGIRKGDNTQHTTLNAQHSRGGGPVFD